MTYELANSIRELVYQMSSTWTLAPYVCALERKTESEDTWSCHLYDRLDTNAYKGELWSIALAIEKAGLDIHTKVSTYNRGTTTEEIVETIEIY